MECLLEEDVKAYYWMGFLMADGHFTGSRVVLSLSIKDEGHLRRFGEFVKYSGRARVYVNRINGKGYRGRKIACMNKKIVPVIMKKYDLVPNKTEYPPKSLSIGNDDCKLALIVGFIDGDGSVNKGRRKKFCNIAVKVHGSWLGILEEMAGLVYRLAGHKSGMPRINKKGYAVWVVSNSMVVKFLKCRAAEMGLPVLDRKWCKINEDLVGEREMSKERIGRIREMAEEGLYQSQIAEKLGMDDSGICASAKRNGIVIKKCGYPRYSRKEVMKDVR